MASLGALTQKKRTIKYTRPIPFWRNYSLPIDLYKVNQIGTLSGTVSVENVLTEGAKVILYYRENGKKIQQTLTNAIGEWSFTGLDVNDAENYHVIAQVEGGFNAMIYDLLTPV